jgi:serine/threonine protein kinase
MNQATSAAGTPRCPQCGSTLENNAIGGLCPRCLLFQASMETDDGDATTSRPSPPDIATVQAAFPQLEVLELIGQGGMGTVYKARQKSLDRFVAIKLLTPKSVGQLAFETRFSREAKALAELNHPNIVTVHDFGQAGGFYFLLMEYVDGVNLRQAMDAGRMSPAQALSIVPSICEALTFAHSRGIVHRDIKPENVLLGKDGQIKIADFGIARIVRLPADSVASDEQETTSRTNDQPQLTGNVVLGTPNYMAPEQFEHPEAVDQRADVYSLGVVLYEMLTGDLPKGNFAMPSRKVQIDVRVDEIVLKALDRNPELRWPTTAAFKAQLDNVSSTSTRQPSTANAFPESSPSASASNRRLALMALGMLMLAICLPILGFYLHDTQETRQIAAQSQALTTLGARFMKEKSLERKLMEKPNDETKDELKDVQARIESLTNEMNIERSKPTFGSLPTAALFSLAGILFGIFGTVFLIFGLVKSTVWRVILAILASLGMFVMATALIAAFYWQLSVVTVEPTVNAVKDEPVVEKP